MDYQEIFIENVKLLMKAQGLNKRGLAAAAGLSTTLVSDLVNGVYDNISLKSMCALADALAVPLPLLLHDPEGEIWAYVKACSAIAPVVHSAGTVDGYERVSAVLTPLQAYKVRKMAEANEAKSK